MKNKLFVIIMAASMLLGTFAFMLIPDKAFSESERRLLAKMPEISAKSLFSGDFMDGFEVYAQDSFPLRDSFRGLKSRFVLDVLKQGDNNGLYTAMGHIAKGDYPMNEKMLQYAAGRMESIYKRYLEGTDCKLYFSIIPDKNRYIAPGFNQLYLNFNELESYMLDKTSYMEYIPIAQQLCANDYYYSDSHWRQERIGPVAEEICSAMGAEVMGFDDSDLKSTASPFKGVYAGQLGIDSITDELCYLENDIIRACTVTSYDSGKPESVDFYDMEAAQSRDPYEMFLNGADALLVIDNPKAKTERELVIFRDSFGSSLAPWLLHSYSKVTLVDIRYINSAMLGQFIDFDKQDVLFIYSTGLLNNSLAMK